MEDSESLEQLRKLWMKANKKTPSSEIVEEAICSFWEYVAGHLKDVDLFKLQNNDMPIIEEKTKIYKEWKDFAMLLSPSGVIYLTMSNLFKNICEIMGADPGTTFILRINQFILKTHDELLDKRVCKEFAKGGKILDLKNISKCRLGFRRYWIVLTSMGNTKMFPLIEKIYEISKRYKFDDDWQIVKYFPAEFRPDDEEIPAFVIPLQNAAVLPGGLKYDMDDSKMLITLAENVSGQDLMIAREVCLSQLNIWFGEYSFAKRINSFNILPETFVLTTNSQAINHLKPVAGLYQQLSEEMFKDTKLCTFCQLRDCNVDFITIDHNKFNTGIEDYLPVGDYCTYCIGCLERLCMDKP
jgi:hypothetical protein